MAKAIDSIPDINGSSLVTGMRLARYTSGFWDLLYEPAGSPTEVLSLLSENDGYSAAFINVAALTSFHVAIEVFQSAHDAPLGRLSEPGPGERSLGLHAIVCAGLTDDGASIRFWNSWGRSWGQHGYGSMSVDYFRRHFHEAWLLWMARWGPAPGKPNPKTLLSSPPTLQRSWMTQLPRFRRRLDGPYGYTWRLERFTTVSRRTGLPISFYEVRNGYGIRMGWIILQLNSATAAVDVVELFVMPAFRRLKIATYLEAVAEAEAQDLGYECLTMQMYDEDGIVSSRRPSRPAARLFGQSRGYEWRWRTQKWPSRTAQGFKTLEPD
jgi:GNAT superfamily N-acetyltransferase